MFRLISDVPPSIELAFERSMVCIAAITSLGQNANATFQYVGSTIGSTDNPPLKKLHEALEKYHAENKAYPVIRPEGTLEIFGVMVGLVRKTA